MSELLVNTIKKADGTGSLAIPAESGTVVTTASPSLGRRNRIFNGDMRIDQRNAGASITPGNGNYTLDRWTIQVTQSSKLSVQQNAGSVTPPVGFTNYLGITSLSAYSVVSTDQFLVSQYIEGLNTADLAWGTANAKTVTVSFWARSSLTGTFSGVIQNSAADRNYPFAYTISSADTWEYKTVTIPGDTTGTWLTTNGKGLRLLFSVGNGSTYAATAGAWTSTVFITAATGTTSVVGTNGATWYITGVQLEVGSVATPFEHRSYGEELALCQRYYYDPNSSTTGVLQGNMILIEAFGGGTCIGAFHFPVSMRTQPTITIFARKNSGQGNIRVTATDLEVGGGNAVAGNVGTDGFGFVQGLSGLTTGEAYDCTYKADAEL